MPNVNALTTVICLDLRKHRIRIPRVILKTMGIPPAIQLLVDPSEMAMAILAVKDETLGNQTHRINRKSLLHKNFYEIYSKEFLERLCRVCEKLEPGASYHVSGSIAPDRTAAVFFLKSLQKIQDTGAET